MNKFMLKSLGLVLLCGLASTSLAAVNPSVAGMQSQGSMDVHLRLEPSVAVTGMTDLPLEYSGSIEAAMNGPGYTTSKQFCVYSSTGSYALTVTTSNGPSAYEADTNSYTLERVGGAPAGAPPAFLYTMNFTGGKTQNMLAYGQQYTGFTGSADHSCAGGTNATLSFNIRKSSMGIAIPNGLFRDTVNVTVAAV